ncbi:MAG: FprA family A-type flavoprotein [Thermoleophilia bacterium]
MKPREVIPNLYWVGAVDWERRLFDSLVPTPEGTSYNSYLLRARDATVLFDTVDPTKTQTLLDNLASVDHIDYVVIHHVEQDHSGSLPAILDRFPTARVLCGPRAVDLITTHLHVDPATLHVMADGEELSLGDKTLRFVHTPWVHWPETISTFLVEDKVLLSGDFFGSHLATTDVFAQIDEVLPLAKRYYAELMMPVRTVVARNLGKVEQLDPAIIAPTHGPAYDQPSLIINAYREWVEGAPHNLVLIPYVTMHASTQKLVERLTGSLINHGVKVELIDAVGADMGHLATSLVDAATIVVGTPTVLTGPHPTIVPIVFLANALRPKVQNLSVVGSYGWATNMVDVIKSLTSGLKAELIDPVVVKGSPQDEDLARIDALAATIAAKHAAAGLI